jgi:hypothetical protein
MISINQSMDDDDDDDERMNDGLQGTINDVRGI